MRTRYTKHRGYSLWPIGIYIPIEHKNTPLEEPLIAHEQAHYERQAGKIVRWLARYFASTRFRWQEEQAAFRAEIAKRRELGLFVDRKRYVDALTSEYGWFCGIPGTEGWKPICSRAQAQAFIDGL